MRNRVLAYAGARLSRRGARRRTRGRDQSRSPGVRRVHTYFQEGSAASLHDVLASTDSLDNPMAMGDELNPEELAALEGFLLSL